MNKEQLKQTRLDKGLTQTEQAEQWGISLRSLQYYEKGDKPIPEVLIRLIDTSQQLESALIRIYAEK